MKNIVVCGAGGFIGSHLVRKLKGEGHYVRGVDLKYPEFSDTVADQFIIVDLRLLNNVDSVISHGIDEVYQLAADMGGAGYIFTGEHDADVIYNSAMINLHVARRSVEVKVNKVFFSSSACIYPEYNQRTTGSPICKESTAYPAKPDSEYGWEKLFSERVYKTFQRNHGVDVRIARFHNIFGPQGTWRDGREKAPAALCRKVAEAKNGGYIDIWGDGKQTRSFLYIDTCLEGVGRLMDSPESFEPLNIGSEEMISINRLAEMIIQISGKKLSLRHVPGPLGVRGRTSDNDLIWEKLHWRPETKLYDGLVTTYDWINKQVNG